MDTKINLFTRSILALGIALSLTACDDGGDKVIEKEPIKPLPTVPVSKTIGLSTVQALQESVVITSLEDEESLQSIEAFKGIQFATAERFTHSVVTDLADEIDATAFGAACPQNATTTQTQSEDCLNLNIWRPLDTAADANLPVYLFIHGGSFETGSGANAMIQGDTVVAQGAAEGNPFIMVTFNYRLGLLGSKWIKGANEDGNFGIGDQKSVLKWVNANIGKFGGDATNVTLMGQGAGAMSIGFLQQDSDLSDTYFQRAIMQSNPYGFDYPSYSKADDYADTLDGYKETLYPSASLDDLSLEEILLVQEKALEPLPKLLNWVGENINAIIPLVGSHEGSPMSTLMPFAPYLLCEETSFLGGCKTLAEQPALSDFTVPTVLGVNSEESNSFGMLPSLTFLIPKIIELIGEANLTDPEDPEQVAQDISDWLATESNVQQVTNTLVSGSPSSDSILDCLDEDTTEAILECLASSITLPTTAYEPVTKLFFGLGNDEITQGTAVDKGFLRLADYFPNSESDLSGATKNMSQFKDILNNMLFDGPARLKAQQESDSGQQVAFYHFEYTPSFNVWSYDTANSGLLDIIKGIGCISGACNSSELPFVFNKGVKLDGSEATTSKKDRALMAKMSRLWFSDALFSDYQYSTAEDNVLIIDADGATITNDWDASNPGVDPVLRGGMLDGLNDLGLFLGYFD